MNYRSDSKQYIGVAASPGLAVATSMRYTSEAPVVPRYDGCNYDYETGRINDARQQIIKELQSLSQRITHDISREEGAVFEAQALIVEDPELEKKCNAGLLKGWNAEAAWTEAIEYFAKQLESLSNPALRARAADIRDVGKRVMKNLIGNLIPEPKTSAGCCILIAEDLAPSETADLDKRQVAAFCTAKGGPLSHTAILARAMGIPAVVGLGDSILTIPDGTKLLVNGSDGKVWVNPDEITTEAFVKNKDLTEQRSRNELFRSHEPAVTIDGHKIEIVANIGNISDANQALQNGAEGVGLFRTEFLFLNQNTQPNEEKQYKTYRELLEVMGDYPVIIRTLDAGGDKQIPYLDQGKESNPSLGWRAIRVSLDCPDVFKPQIRALLRAGAGRDLRIMFPLIATLEEFRKARALFETAKQELSSTNTLISENIKIGIMIETPAAVVMADQLAREVDFFSIGTNDLTQYSMAADRTNERVAYLNDACHPAIFRQIKRVIEAGHRTGIKTGICGELAGDPEAIPVLLGLDADELSMSSLSIPGAKSLIRSCSWEKTKNLAQEALEKETSSQIRSLVRDYMKTISGQ
jgi:phosphoenolpyruvate-protein phosphotransferase